LEIGLEKLPKASIIIATRNRQSSLRESLSSLSGLKYCRDRFEIIVVDDDSDDGTENAVMTMKPLLPYAVRYFGLKERKNTAGARNVGMRMADADILVFTDDDCLFPEDWLSLLVAPFNSPRVGVVGGPDVAPEDSSFFSKCVDYLFTSFIGTGGLRRGNKLRVGKYYAKGCNMAVLRRAIQEVGGFDESLVPGEDIEMAYRIEKAGYLITFADKAFVWHRRKDNVRDYLRKMYGIGYTRVVLGRKHAGLNQIGHMIPFLGVTTTMSLGALSFFSPMALRLLTVFLGGYLLIALAAGVQSLFRIRDLRAVLVIPFLVAIHHAAHGVGYLVAGFHWLFGFTRAERKPLQP
jgi:GT2 family glycosyltransferase